MNNGYSVFNHTQSTEEEKRLLIISQEQFELWQKDFMWEALHGIRYGQSFCNHFGITDNLLYYTMTPEESEQYIKHRYIA